MKYIVLIAVILFAIQSNGQQVKAKKTVVKYAAGISSDSKLLRNETPGLSGLYFLGTDSLVQASFLMASSDPNEISLGGYYKKNLYGNILNGFHAGVGYGTGSFDTDRSYWRLLGVAGFHFVVSKRVYVSFDASIAIGKDLDPSDDSLQIGGNSQFLGLSLYWLL